MTKKQLIYLDHSFKIFVKNYKQLLLMKTLSKLTTISYIVNPAITKFTAAGSCKLLITTCKSTIAPSTKLVVSKVMTPLVSKSTIIGKVGSLGMIGTSINSGLKLLKYWIAGLIGLGLGYFVKLYKMVE